MPHVDVGKSLVLKAVYKKHQARLVCQESKSNLGILVGDENLLVPGRWRSERVIVRSARRAQPRFWRFVNVVETRFVGGESKPAQVSAGKGIGKAVASLNVKHLKDSGPLSSLFNFVQKQPTIA